MCCLLHASPHTECPLRLLHKPPDFEQCTNLQALLAQLKCHILESDSTRQCYAFICQRIARELQTGDSDGFDATTDDIKAHFESKWPRFVPLRPDHMKYKDEMHWGMVDEDGHYSN